LGVKFHTDFNYADLNYADLFITFLISNKITEQSSYKPFKNPHAT